MQGEWVKNFWLSNVYLRCIIGAYSFDFDVVKAIYIYIYIYTNLVLEQHVW